MTDTSSVTITYSTREPYPVAAHPLNSPVPNGTVSDSIPAEDDEPYTIKCICTFQDDDGNTVFCERCETWQHIECYYHGREVPDVHNCTECEPRPLDAKRATERQRRLREQSDGGDRKPKRSGTKNQKKKPKDHHDQPNGSHYCSESSSRDQPPAKKPKINHKASTSVSSLPAVPVLPQQQDPRKRSGSTTNPMSPTKPSVPPIPLYSAEFLELYEQDLGHVDVQSNLFDNLVLAQNIASWVKEPSYQDFLTLSDTFDPSQWPVLANGSITDNNVEYDGKHPTWKLLKTESKIRKDEIVGEIKGKLGQLRNYCHDPANRWPELLHPQPFVFFHPQLPIYIDCRKEGTMLRYIRRSCRPNVTMKTFITNNVEYHFCFVANQDIPANHEITAMWCFDPQLFRPSNHPGDEAMAEATAISISNVLAHFGGCACDPRAYEPPQGCLLASMDRRRNLVMKQTNGKRKRAKMKQAMSPLNTGRANRAASEGAKNLEDDDQTDSRSASGSIRGQTHSRDLTPTLQNQCELVPGDSELSARDRRKIAAVEKKFEQLEQDQQVGQKKKKRTNGQSTQTTPIAVSSKQTGYFSNPGSNPRALRLDTAAVYQPHSPPRLSPGSASVPRNALSQKSSGSSTPSVRSPLYCRSYVDAETQTEIDEHDLQPAPSTPSYRRTFIPLTQRLLKRCHEDRLKFEGTIEQRDVPVSMAPVSNDDSHPACAPNPDGRLPGMNIQPIPNGLDDIEMKDAETGTTLSKTHPPDMINGTVRSSLLHSRTPNCSVKSSSAPWPSDPAPSAPFTRNVNGFRSELRLQLPQSLFSSLPPPLAPGLATTSSLQSPCLEAASAHPGTQTPGSGIAAPSPVKKKLSLGDYFSRRGTLATPTSEKQSTNMLPPRNSPSRPSVPSFFGSGDSHGLSTSGTEALKCGSPSAADVSMRDVTKPSSPSYKSSIGTSDYHTKFPS